MTTRSQRRKAVAELASGKFESPTVESNQNENLIAGSSVSPRVQPETFEDVKTSSGKEILSDLAEMLAENQKEMMKLIVPMIKKIICSSKHSRV